MKSIIIAFITLTLLTSSALFILQTSNKTEDLEMTTPANINIGKLHLKVNLKNLGKCAMVVTGAVKSCGAAISSEGTDIMGDIGCVKSILSAKSCAHVF